MRPSENILLSHLTDVDSLDILAAEGFGTEKSCEVLSSEISRAIVRWALTLYFDSGRKVALSKQAILQTWGDEMEALGLEINDETELDPLEWAIDDLRSAHALHLYQEFAKSSSVEIAEANGPDRTRILQEKAQELFAISRSVVSRRQEIDAGQGLELALDRYYERVEDGQEIRGMAFGLPSIDRYTKGIHDGELAVFAGYSGIGKSWVAVKTSFEEWKRNRLCTLFTLENSIEMTMDRMACVGAGVHYENWQIGKCTEEEIHRVKLMAERIKESDNAPRIIMPPKEERTATMMVQRALADNSDSMIIDQLSFIHPSKGKGRGARWETISEIVRELAEAIGEKKEKIPCLLLAQINRKGKEEAAKIGHYSMEHLAEASEVERTASFVFAGYQSEVHIRDNGASWQTLKTRRVANSRDFEMIWELGRGHIAVEGDDPPEVLR